MVYEQLPQCPTYHTVLKTICIEEYNGYERNMRAWGFWKNLTFECESYRVCPLREPQLPTFYTILENLW